MKLIVGLGNPGKEYKSTRHNMGFQVIDNFAEENNISIDKDKFGGLYNELIINDEKIILLKPQKYINLSGEVIKKYVDYFKIDISDILVISDDLDMPFGNIRVREKPRNALINEVEIFLCSSSRSMRRLKAARIRSGGGNRKAFTWKQRTTSHQRNIMSAGTAHFLTSFDKADTPFFPVSSLILKLN